MKTIKLGKLQAGIGLVEIMIASLIGLFLMGGLMQMFITSKQTYEMQDTISRLQENGRFAMDFLVRDIRGTGSWGCFNDTTSVANLLNPELPGVPLGSVFGDFDLDNTDGTQKIDTVIIGEDDHIPAGAGDLVLTGTDTLSMIGVTTLRNDTTGAAVIIESAPADASAISDPLTISAGSSLKKGDIVFVSDCDLGDVLQVTNISNAGGVATVSYDACTAASCDPSPGNSDNTLGKVYRKGSNLYNVNFFNYEIRNGESGEPALFRTTNNGNAQELIEGVENMQILYGADTDDDGTPNFYLPAGQVSTSLAVTPNMSQVVSIKISLVIRSQEDDMPGNPIPYMLNGVSVTPTDPTNHQRIRRVFSSVITIRNRLS